MLGALLATILFSISAVSATRTARLMGGTEANFWRLCVATLLLGLFAHGWGMGLSGAGLSMLFLSGCVGFGLGDVALFQALPRLGSRLTVLIVHCLAAPMAGISEWLWLGTTLSAGQILSALVILSGVALALAPGGHLKLDQTTFLVGILFGVFAAFGQGFGAVMSRVAYDIAAQAGQGVDGISAAYQRILGGVVVSGLFLLLVKRRSFWDQRSRVILPSSQVSSTPEKWRRVWFWILINGTAGPALGVSCYQWALMTTPTAVVLPIVALTPLVVIPFSNWMEGEKPTRRSLLGGGVAVLGVIAMKLLG